MIKIDENISKSGYNQERRGIKSVWFLKKSNREKSKYTTMVIHSYLQLPF
ncbi:MAG: hypothetical protein OCD02_21755 [Spirochaetaceae bacterium]